MNASDHDAIAFASTHMPETIAPFVARWSIAEADQPTEMVLGRLLEALEQISAFFGALAVLEYVRREDSKDTGKESRKTRGEMVQRPGADMAVAFLREGDRLTWGS